MTDRATLDLFAAIPAEKRWHRREQRWVAPGRLFDPKGFAVEIAEELAAKAWIVEQHYSGTYPAARLAVGLYGPGARMLGCAVFSVPMNQQVITAYTGQAPNRGAELGRFVCAPDVAYNGETWLLARAFQALRAEKPEPHESLAAWVQRVTNAPGFERRRHPGNLTYLFGLTRDAKAQLAKRYGSGQPYPRKEAA